MNATGDQVRAAIDELVSLAREDGATLTVWSELRALPEVVDRLGGNIGHPIQVVIPETEVPEVPYGGKVGRSFACHFALQSCMPDDWTAGVLINGDTRLIIVNEFPDTRLVGAPDHFLPKLAEMEGTLEGRLARIVALL